MKTPHKHQAVIHAFADGKTIQVLNGDGAWIDTTMPNFHPLNNYRVKPEPVPDIVRYVRVGVDSCSLPRQYAAIGYNLKLTFDGKTQELIKAEVLWQTRK